MEGEKRGGRERKKDEKEKQQFLFTKKAEKGGGGQINVHYWIKKRSLHTFVISIKYIFNSVCLIVPISCSKHCF